jgi:hypothetical protein
MIVRGHSVGIGIPWRDGGARIVPLMTADELRNFFPRYKEIEPAWRTNPNADAVSFPLEVISCLMARRYPEITLKEIADNLTPDELPRLWRARRCPEAC